MQGSTQPSALGIQPAQRFGAVLTCILPSKDAVVVFAALEPPVDFKRV